jgi:hypothetical protein
VSNIDQLEGELNHGDIETLFVHLADQSRIGDRFSGGTEACQLIEDRGRLSQLHVQPIAELVQISLQVPLP